MIQRSVDGQLFQVEYDCRYLRRKSGQSGWTPHEVTDTVKRRELPGHAITAVMTMSLHDFIIFSFIVVRSNVCGRSFRPRWPPNVRGNVAATSKSYLDQSNLRI